MNPITNRMKQISLIPVVALLLFLSASCSSKLPVSKEIVPQSAEWLAEESTRTISVDEMIGQLQKSAPRRLIHAARDEYPGGLSAVMSPFLVQWEESMARGIETGVIISNVQVGGSAARGLFLNASIRIPADAVKEVQWCLVLNADGDNKDTDLGHGQLRFIFHKDKMATVLLADGTPDPEREPIPDLIISWEAWRGTQVGYDFLGSLDPARYALSARAYAGHMRFTTDALRGRTWRCFPLNLPGDDGTAERSVFYHALMMGDILARRFVHEMHHDLSDDQKARLDALLCDEQIANLSQKVSLDQVPDDHMRDLFGTSDASYQLILRSCITQALTCVELAMEDYYRKNDLGKRKSIKVTPKDIPSWMKDPTAEKGSAWTRVPSAMWWVMTNGNVIPGKT